MEKVILVDENDNEIGTEEKIKAHMDSTCFIYKTKINDLFENEYDHIFIGKSDQDPRPNPQEVESYQWIDQEKLKKDILANPDKYTYWFKASLKNVLKFTT